jgi:hypothetical protein
MIGGETAHYDLTFFKSLSMNPIDSRVSPRFHVQSHSNLSLHIWMSACKASNIERECVSCEYLFELRTSGSTSLFAYIKFEILHSLLFKLWSACYSWSNLWFFYRCQCKLRKNSILFSKLLSAKSFWWSTTHDDITAQWTDSHPHFLHEWFLLWRLRLDDLLKTILNFEHQKATNSASTFGISLSMKSPIIFIHCLVPKRMSFLMTLKVTQMWISNGYSALTECRISQINLSHMRFILCSRKTNLHIGNVLDLDNSKWSERWVVVKRFKLTFRRFDS